MVIHNATVMGPKYIENEIVARLKEEIEGMELSGEMKEGINPRISVMREAGGISHEEADATSVAFQVEFPDILSAKRWGEHEFDALAQRIALQFGAETMIFTSLFEVI